MKLNQTKIASIILVLLGITGATAQKTVSYPTYKEALHVINPAQVGVTNKKEAMISIKSYSISGIENSPQTQIASFSMPLKRNLSAGLSILNDSYDITKETEFYADVSYKLALDETKNLYFGLKAGGSVLNINTGSKGFQSDPAFNKNVGGGFNANFGVGLYLEGTDYFVSFAVPRILKHSVRNNESDVYKQQLYLGGGYTYTFKSERPMQLTPSLLLRYDVGSSMVVELATAFELMHKFELGLSTRFKESFGVLAMFKFLDKFKIGYAFESILSDLGGNSHQVILRASF